MDKELEEYLKWNMIIDKYTDEMYNRARKIFYKEIDFNKLNIWKRFKIGYKISNYNSKEFQRIKQIQEHLLKSKLKAQEK